MNFLCLLGWSPKENREKMPIEEIIGRFELSAINRKGAVFDAQKLAWLQGEYLRELPEERFREGAITAFDRAGLRTADHPAEYVAAAIRTCLGKVRFFSELPAYAGFYFAEPGEGPAEAVAKHFVPENRARIAALREAFSGVEPFEAASLEAALKGVAGGLGVKPAVLVHPVRLALTGATAGPSLYHLVEVLGRERVLARLDRALERIPAA